MRAAGRNAADGPWAEFVEFDLERAPFPPSLIDGVDSVFHLAGKAHASAGTPAEAQEHFKINFEGTKALISLVEGSQVERFVYLSSVKALSQDSPYGTSKKMAEEAVLGSVAAGVHAVVLRPALIYGPNLKGNLLRMSQAVKSGRFPPVGEYGNRRSMVHVDDVVKAMILAAQEPAALGRTYVLTDNQDYSSRRVYLAMCAAVGREVPNWTVPLSILKLSSKVGDFCQSLLGIKLPINSEVVSRLIDSEHHDSSRIRQDLGWSSQHVLEDSAAEILLANGRNSQAPFGSPRE